MAVKEVIWQDGEGSLPASGDKITLQAAAWSGTQQVTVQTPENFGIFRAMNIVFYSSEDSTKTATLRVTQEAATASLSPTTVVFQNTDTDAKTITISTNISTASRISIALEGTDASQFTLSALSALSGGKCTFTIKPNSINSGSSARNCSIRVKVGRLADNLIPVEQLADEVVSTEYSNYRLENLSIIYATRYAEPEEVTDTTLIRAKLGSLAFQGTPMRTKKVTYSSGKVETTEEAVPDSNTIYISVGIQSSTTALWRMTYANSLTVSAIKAAKYIVPVPSQEYTLWQGDPATLRWQISDAAIVGDPSGSGQRVETETNKRESYSNYSNKNFPSRNVAAEGGSVTCNASAYGTCTYTSGASRTENVPMKFEFVGSVSWASITSQIPGAAGTSLEISSCSINASANTSTTSSRSLRVSALPRLADGSTGGSEVGTIAVNQASAMSSVYEVTVVGGSMEVGQVTINDSTKEFLLEESDHVAASMPTGGVWRITLTTASSSAMVSVYAGGYLMWQRSMNEGDVQNLTYADMKSAIDKGDLEWEFSVTAE